MEENSSDDDIEHFDIRNRIAIELNGLKQLCKENNISEKDFSACLENVIGKKTKSFKPGVLVSLCLRYICGFLLIIILLYFVISCHNPTNKFFSRYTQELVYPVMRMFRLCSLMLLKNINAESYVHLYQEPCLMQNPFYKEPYVDCWPCENVRFIIDLSHLKNSTDIYQQSGIPFIIKDVLEEDVSFPKLQKIFLNYKNLLKAGTLLFESHHPFVSTVDDLFDEHSFELHSFPDIHVKWSLNKVPAVQIIRKLFKRPYFIPSQTEVALQKFIFIDGVKGPSYDFPMTDFANVWLAQGSGSHLIVLLPSPQCKKTCSTVSVLLEKKDILCYDWQFWRAKSYSVNTSEKIGITYMGSFY